jgi:two-component system nitrate/nitrite response regulator NarL
MSAPIKVIHVDDAKLFRDGISSLLKEFPGIQLIGGADNGLELFSVLKIVEPDVIILDVEMPVMGGDETLMRLKKEFPLIKVIMLSTYYESYLIVNFFANGASAYLKKDVAIEVLVDAIESVHLDGHYLGKKNAEFLIQSAAFDINKKQLIGLKRLDETEEQVLRLMGEGLSSKQIATIMNISRSMVDKHKLNIKSKTKSKNVAEMILNGVWHGIIPVFKVCR